MQDEGSRRLSVPRLLTALSGREVRVVEHPNLRRLAHSVERICGNCYVLSTCLLLAPHINLLINKHALGGVLNLCDRAGR